MRKQYYLKIITVLLLHIYKRFTITLMENEIQNY